eukprot:335501-Hanusia_phi.AAC.1
MERRGEESYHGVDGKQDRSNVRGDMHKMKERGEGEGEGGRLTFPILNAALSAASSTTSRTLGSGLPRTRNRFSGEELLGPVLLRVIPEDPVVVDEDAVGAGGAPGKDAPCKLVEERFPAGPGVLREGEDAEGTHAERAEGPIDRLLLPKRPTPPLHANDVHRERRALVGGAEVHEAAVSPPLHVVLDHQICPLLLRQPRELGHGVAKEMQICVHEQPSEALLHDPQQDVRLDLDDLREPSCSPADGGSL